MSGLEEKRPGSLGRIKPQNWKAKKARGVGKATNLWGFGAGKNPKNRKQRKRGGLVRQPTWGDLGRVKPQKAKAKKARGLGRQPTWGDLGRVKPQKAKAKKKRGGWEGNQPGGIWGG